MNSAFAKQREVELLGKIARMTASSYADKFKPG
jgi:hypothetical protein